MAIASTKPFMAGDVKRGDSLVRRLRSDRRRRRASEIHGHRISPRMGGVVQRGASRLVVLLRIRIGIPAAAKRIDGVDLALQCAASCRGVHSLTRSCVSGSIPMLVPVYRWPGHDRTRRLRAGGCSRRRPSRSDRRRRQEVSRWLRRLPCERQHAGRCSLRRPPCSNRRRRQGQWHSRRGRRLRRQKIDPSPVPRRRPPARRTQAQVSSRFSHWSPEC